jgi:hypothetical protein
MRSCNSCTKCCEGYLSANIKGQEISLGKPCLFVEISVGCKDYENRPSFPCKEFKCEWVRDLYIPEEFSPAKTGVIFNTVQISDIVYLNAIEAGNPITAEVLSWLFIKHKNDNINIAWQMSDLVYWAGDKEFSRLMSEKYS